MKWEEAKPPSSFYQGRWWWWRQWRWRGVRFKRHVKISRSWRRILHGDWRQGRHQGCLLRFLLVQMGLTDSDAILGDKKHGRRPGFGRKIINSVLDTFRLRIFFFSVKACSIECLFKILNWLFSVVFVLLIFLTSSSLTLEEMQSQVQTMAVYHVSASKYWCLPNLNLPGE